MIDFPSAPTDGQLFWASNNVAYQWDAAKGLWLVAAASNVRGDFFATVASPNAVSGSLAVVLFATVVTGNAGGWYNPANGRFTPPPGRYLLTYTLYANLTAAGHFHSYFYKNGATIGGAASQYVAASGGNGTVANSIEVDANGTDYFDVRVNATASGTINGANFSAIPVGTVVALPTITPANTPANFTAVYAGVDFAIAAAGAVIVTPTVLNGNEGSWFNPANGRFTPPAGRYTLSGMLTGFSGSALVHINLSLRKNGAAIGTMQATTAAANSVTEPSIVMNVDANGTDYFELYAGGNIAFTGRMAAFSATPVGVLASIPAFTGPGLDPGTKSTAQVGSTATAVTPSRTNVCTTGQVGLAGQKWRISATVVLTNNPQQWSYGYITDGTTDIANGAQYNAVNGAAGTVAMERIVILTGPTTFTLQANCAAAGGTASSGMITAQRLT